jgi:hypothetical protein
MYHRFQPKYAKEHGNGKLKDSWVFFQLKCDTCMKKAGGKVKRH